MCGLVKKRPPLGGAKIQKEKKIVLESVCRFFIDFYILCRIFRPHQKIFGFLFEQFFVSSPQNFFDAVRKNFLCVG